jgi:hypothetical protein
VRIVLGASVARRCALRAFFLIGPVLIASLLEQPYAYRHMVARM